MASARGDASGEEEPGGAEGAARGLLVPFISMCFYVYIYIYIVCVCVPSPPSPQAPSSWPWWRAVWKRVNVRVWIAERGSAAKLLTQGYEAWLGRLWDVTQVRRRLLVASVLRELLGSRGGWILGGKWNKMEAEAAGEAGGCLLAVCRGRADLLFPSEGILSAVVSAPWSAAPGWGIAGEEPSVWCLGFLEESHFNFSECNC